MKDAHEHDLRIKAIRLYDDGIGFNEILRVCRQAFSDSRADFLSYGFRLS